MGKLVLRGFALAWASFLLASCAAPVAGPSALSDLPSNPMSPTTRLAREVLLTPKNDQPVLGKLIDIDGESVTFLPSPYWNETAQNFDVDEIVTVEVKDRTNSAGKSTGFLMATLFVVVGCSCGANAQYNEDYRQCLNSAAGAAAAGAVVGLILGAPLDGSGKNSYRLDKMTPAKKREVLLRLMAR